MGGRFGLALVVELNELCQTMRCSKTLTLFCGFCLFASLKAETPNVIYILADDLGFGNLSCYGQMTLQAPHLGRLAQNGMKFTSHYSGATVCAPSHYMLLTGKHSGRGTIRDNGHSSLPESDYTLAKLFKQVGYRTACIGKCGVGRPPDNDDPWKAGFDEFYGYLNMFYAHNYYPGFMIRNGEHEALRNEVSEYFKNEAFVRESLSVATKKVDYAPQLIYDETLKFIRANKENPFFLYYALNISHANNEVDYDWSATGKRSNNPNADGMAVPDDGKFPDREWPIQEKGFARIIQHIDDWVGKIVALDAELDAEHPILAEVESFKTIDEGYHILDENADGHRLLGVDNPKTMRAPSGPGKYKTVTYFVSSWETMPPRGRILHLNESWVRASPGSRKLNQLKIIDYHESIA